MKKGMLIALASLAIIAGGCGPPPELTEGNTYWVKAPMVFHDVTIYTKPGRGTGEICGVLPNATEARLVKLDGKWCYVEAIGELGPEEGWLECIALVDHYITPIPTPNRTPQRPEG